ncbi:ogr/Delta-like zinc finger family protein [Orbus wheelerorum]|uniref:ogr/Delta-like zinc finger family protein n=1 Tax=Orbus wheelerorum TaxID=3074111 RepID=UPI00370DB814
MSRTALLFCPECGQKAIITKTARAHKLLNYRYCSCSDPECGLTFRIKEEFEKVLSPSAKGFNRLNDYLMQHGSHSQLALDIINPA